jgi:hypothetical protein
MAGEHSGHPRGVDVTVCEGRVDQDDKVDVSEIPGSPKQDLLRFVHRKLSCKTRRHMSVPLYQPRADQTRSSRTPLDSADRSKHGDRDAEVWKAPAEQPGGSQVREHRLIRKDQAPRLQVSYKLFVLAQAGALGDEQTVTDAAEAANTHLSADRLSVVPHV